MCSAIVTKQNYNFLVPILNLIYRSHGADGRDGHGRGNGPHGADGSGRHGRSNGSYGADGCNGHGRCNGPHGPHGSNRSGAKWEINNENSKRT